MPTRCHETTHRVLSYCLKLQLDGIEPSFIAARAAYWGYRSRMRMLFALPGFHAQDRGAEVALLAVARELACGGDAVTVMGGGPDRPGEPYRYLHVPIVERRKFE